ncbi:hypothetical protein J2Y37_002179, partial [Prolinoborus sp. 3657]|nr:hypothetical protein [Prolinoborus sp. 3657]
MVKLKVLTATILVFGFSMHGYASTPTTMQKMTDDELAATEAQALMS